MGMLFFVVYLLHSFFRSVQTGEVMYELSRANPTSTEDITVTITSKPIDGVDAIEVNFRTDETNIQFSPMTMVRRIYNTTNFFLFFFVFCCYNVRHVVSPE